MNNKNWLFSVIITVASLFLLAGCTTKPVIRDYSSSEHIRIETKQIKNYTVGEEKRAYVGQPLVRNTVERFGIFPKHVAKTEESFAYEIGWRDIEIEAGIEYLIRGKATVDETEYYVVLVPGHEGQTYGLLVTENGSVSEHVINLGYTKPSGWMLVSGVGGQLAAGSLMLGSFELKPKTATLIPVLEKQNLANVPGGKPTKGYELVYYGLDRDQLRFWFRELRDDDPISSQELTYDSSKSSFRFQDYVIDVIDATADHIDFVVVSD